jgi:hypothetical protein
MNDCKDDINPSDMRSRHTVFRKALTNYNSKLLVATAFDLNGTAAATNVEECEVCVLHFIVYYNSLLFDRALCAILARVPDGSLTQKDSGAFGALAVDHGGDSRSIVTTFEDSHSTKPAALCSWKENGR